jgi:glyoxylate reductase
LINAKKIALMKSTAYLVNNSRGAVVEEQALLEALRRGQIAGTALDVFEQEPTPSTNPLLKFENVVVAPHISSGSIETRARMSEMFAEKLKTFFAGQKPPNLVNIRVLKVKSQAK